MEVWLMWLLECVACVCCHTTSGSGIADIVVVFAESMRRPPGHHTKLATWEARRAEVVELRRLGWNYKTIARTKRVSLSFVAAAVKRYKETKSHCDRPRSGRPLKATPAVAKKTVSLLRDKKVGSVRKARAKLRGKGIDHITRYGS